MNGSLDDDEEPHNGYDGMTKPVLLEDINDSTEPAVVVGSLRQDGHIITADSHGILLVERAPLEA